METTNTQDTETYLNTTEILEYLNISRSKLYKLGKQGKLRPRAGLKGNLFLKEEIDDMLKNFPVKDSYMTLDEIKEKSKY